MLSTITLFSKLITEADLESRLIAINGIGIDFLSVDDLNSLLNCVLGYCKDNVDKVRLLQ